MLFASASPSRVQKIKRQQFLSAGAARRFREKFFSAYEPVHAYELWVTDGTSDGTKMVRDINPDAADGNPYGFTAMGGKTYFAADDGSHGYELWVTNGTAAGTRMVKDINTVDDDTDGVTDDSSPYNFIAIGKNLYFVADDGSTGEELWVSDGTSAGTHIAKDIYLGTTGSEPYELTAMDGKLYFGANDANGSELWVSDGTDAGTTRVKDIYVGSESAGVSELTAVGNRLFFRARENGTDGYALWISDGTNAGTTMVEDFNSDSIAPSVIEHLTEMKGLLYFSGANVTGNDELWVSDGTAGGTEMIAETNPAPGTGIAPWEFSEIGGRLYFCGHDSTNGQELWVADGTLTGTRMVENIGGTNNSYPKFFAGISAGVCFMATEGSGIYELWITDGTTTTGTDKLKAITLSDSYSGVHYFTEMNDKLYFMANDTATTNGTELWVTDGTGVGTYMLKDININPGDSSYPSFE